MLLFLQELLTRSSLEHHKLDLMAEVSHLKMRLASAEKDRRDLDDRCRAVQVVVCSKVYTHFFYFCFLPFYLCILLIKSPDVWQWVALLLLRFVIWCVLLPASLCPPPHTIHWHAMWGKFQNHWYNTLLLLLLFVWKVKKQKLIYMLLIVDIFEQLYCREVACDLYVQCSV